MYLLFCKPAGYLRHILLAAFLSLYAAAAYAGGNNTGEAALTDSVPAHWTYDEHFNQSIPTDDNWWHQLGDPLLDSLIARGIENNPNVVIAGKRIVMAKEALNAARAGYYPSLGLQGGWTKARSSGALGNVSMPATTTDYFSLGLNMSWEIDVFGKISAKASQQKALYNATRAEYAATMVTLCANIAKAYVNLRVWQAEWQVAVEHIASQEKIVKITEARHEAGLASMLDVTQARIVYYSTQASMPTLRSSIRTTINSIALLLGVYPRDINDLLEPTSPLPDHRQIVPVGVPAELLRRRPDIVEAEYELASYAAALGIAKRDFLPTLSLNGSIGTGAHSAGDLFSRNSLTYSIEPTLTWTIFDGMSRRANMASARQQMEIGIESYNNTVMTAVEEVDNAITTYAGTLRNLDILDDVVTQSRKSLDLSLDLYKRGLSPFNNVVTAQMNLLEYQNSVVTASGNALTALITLYEALGGGWDAADM
ncbi:efflux transporter outer membrane subunit [Muribaculum intestinale]|uniref:efflux transporter outer membrane subunit n=1 Tax=Muribaculum intestinale TaxID=1796646 RepID=UPI0024319111|nr:efflux transporter outer membrane subunit [Muribaculum intestinale]